MLFWTWLGGEGATEWILLTRTRSLLTLAAMPMMGDDKAAWKIMEAWIKATAMLMQLTLFISIALLSLCLGRMLHVPLVIYTPTRLLWACKIEIKSLKSWVTCSLLV